MDEKLKSLASKRNMKDETVGPVITWTTKAMLDHVQRLLQLPGKHSTAPFAGRSTFTDKHVDSAHIGSSNVHAGTLAHAFYPWEPREMYAGPQC